MTRRIVLCVVMIFLAFFPTACSLPARTQGPMTWIDQPLDGVHLPLEPLTIQAHASDGDGVATIEFYVAESLVSSVPAGNRRLGEASIQWMPPGAGVYIIRASGVDSQGNVGSKASVEIVVEAAIGTPTLTPAPATSQCASGSLVAPVLVSPADGVTVQPDPLLSWTYPDPSCRPHSYRIDISEDASFADIRLGFGTNDYNENSRTWPLAAGKCYYWRALAYVPDVNGPASPAWRFCVSETAGPSFTLAKNANCREGPSTAYEIDDTLYEGQTIPIEGRNEDNTWLRVRKPSGSGYCWVSVVTGQITGDLNTVQYASAPPPPEPTSEESTDSPPRIDAVSVDPPSIRAESCGGEPSTAYVNATVTDDGGVSYVAARTSGGEVAMSAVGGGAYQAVLGPFYDAGELSIVIVASDNAGNSAQSGTVTLTVTCSG